MSDIIDALNIIANMTNSIADYRLTKDRLESAQQHEIDMFNRKQQAEADRVNINTTLNLLDDNLKLNREDLRKRSDEFITAGQNVDEIINLPDAFKTPGGSSVATTQEEITFSNLGQTFEAGQNIGETIKNQETALKGTNFALNQLDLLSTINNNIIKTANSDLLKRENNVAVDLNSFKELFESQAFKDDFEDKLGFAIGEDDPDTEHIDESKIDIDSLLYGGAKSRLKDISDESTAIKNQNDSYTSLLKLNEEIEGTGVYFVETDEHGRTVNRNLPLTRAKYREMMNNGASIFEKRGISTYDPDADDVDETAVFNSRVKNLGKEYSGTLSTFIESINNKIENLPNTEWFSTELKNALSAQMNPRDAVWQSPNEITLMGNAIEQETASNLIALLGWGYDKTGLATPFPHLSLAWPEGMHSDIQAEFRELVEGRSLEDTQLYSTFEDGKLVKRGLVDMILGNHKVDENGQSVAYQPGKGRVDQWVVDYLDLGGIMSGGANESFSLAYDMALLLNHIRQTRGQHSDIVGPNPFFNISSQNPVIITDEDEFFIDFDLGEKSWSGAETFEEAIELWDDAWNTGDMGGGEDDPYAGYGSKAAYDAAMLLDKPKPEDFQVSDEGGSNPLDLDKKVKKETPSKKPTSSASTDNLLDFANSITNARDAKVYTGGFGANAMYNAARMYSLDPDNPKNKSRWERYYNKYIRK